MRSFSSKVFALFFVANMVATAVSEQHWQYLASKSVRPTPRSVQLTQEIPDDFVAKVSFNGTLQRYAQLRYGSENSRRVVVVIDEPRSTGDYQFYADLNRDRVLDEDEKLVGSGRRRQLTLAAEIIRTDQVEQQDRVVELRLGLTGKQLSVATVGYVEGEILDFDDHRPLRVRRIDGDANGLFADSRDRTLFDLNRDGHWDLVTEQFIQKPVLKWNGRRFAVRSDRMGKSLSVQEINGTGSLSLTMNGLSPQAKVAKFEAMVFSNDGSAFAIRDLKKTLDVPVGKYVLGSISMTLDMGNRDLWHYVFSRTDKPSKYDWRDVKLGQHLRMEVIGETRFVLKQRSHFGRSHVVAPGANLIVSPAWYTQDGLLINLCSRGRYMGSFDRDSSHQTCETLLKYGSQTLGSAQSGFS